MLETDDPTELSSVSSVSFDGVPLLFPPAVSSHLCFLVASFMVEEIVLDPLLLLHKAGA
jgi:hypothetical protein